MENKNLEFKYRQKKEEEQKGLSIITIISLISQPLMSNFPTESHT